jgi:hypothetical protein
MLLIRIRRRSAVIGVGNDEDGKKSIYISIYTRGVCAAMASYKSRTEVGVEGPVGIWWM